MVRLPIGRGNWILSALSSSDQELILPHLEHVALERALVLEEPGQPVRDVYFIEKGLVSTVAEVGGDRDMEIGVIGPEGATGSAVILGNDRSPHRTFMQIGGAGRRLDASRLRDAMDSSRTFRTLLLRSERALSIQTAHTALANGRAKIEERLARWLLMAHDRVDGDELPLTQGFLSTMMGVRRAGVTVVLGQLDQQGLIARPKPGLIQVIDREGLEAVANDFYGVPEAELIRLFTRN